MEETKSIFEGLDWIILGLYFAILVGVAVWVALQKNKNTEDYFLAGRNVGWFVIGASIFASNIGSEHVVGLAGTGFSSGTPLAHYELHAWIVLLLGWLFLPFYIEVVHLPCLNSWRKGLIADQDGFFQFFHFLLMF